MTPQQPQRLTLPQTQAQRECPMHTVALLRRGLQHPPDLHKGQRLDLTDGATRLVHQPAHVDGHQPAADRGLQRAREHVVGQQHRRRCKAVLDHQAVEALHPHRREPIQPALAQARDDPGTRRRPVPLPGPGTQPMHSNVVQPEPHPLPHRRHPAAGKRQAAIPLPLQRSDLDGDLGAGAASNVPPVPPPIRPPTHRDKPLPATLLVPQNAASTRLPPRPSPACARHGHNHPPGPPPRLRQLTKRVGESRTSATRSPDREATARVPPAGHGISASSCCAGATADPHRRTQLRADPATDQPRNRPQHQVALTRGACPNFTTATVVDRSAAPHQPFGEPRRLLGDSAPPGPDQLASTAMLRPVTPTAGLPGNAAVGRLPRCCDPAVVVCNPALLLRTARGSSGA
jgi:hypothetical protein